MDKKCMRLEARKRNARRGFTWGFFIAEIPSTECKGQQFCLRDQHLTWAFICILGRGNQTSILFQLIGRTVLRLSYWRCLFVQWELVCEGLTQCESGCSSWNRPTVLYLLLQVAHRCVRHRSCRLVSDLMSTVTWGNGRQPSRRSHHKILKENNLLSFKSYYYITITSKKFLTFLTLKMCFHSSIVQLSLCVWSQAPTRSFYLHSKHIVQSR